MNEQIAPIADSTHEDAPVLQDVYQRRYEQERTRLQEHETRLASELGLIAERVAGYQDLVPYPLPGRS